MENDVDPIVTIPLGSLREVFTMYCNREAKDSTLHKVAFFAVIAWQRALYR